MKKRMIKILFMVVMIVGLIPFGAVTAFAENGVLYLDADGVTQTADNVTEISYDNHQAGGYGPGWYLLRDHYTDKFSLNSIIFSGNGEVHLILANNQTVTVDEGIILNEASISLTIYAQPTGEGEAEGKLTVNGGDQFAGIGSGKSGKCGNITVNGGTIIAKGGSYDDPGIGAGNKSTCGDIVINGGTVTANGGSYGAGIGCGYRGTCGNITVNGGNVTAVGGYYCAGIGTGISGSCANITVGGGNVTAIGGEYNGGIPGIGAGERGTCGDIAITGTPEIKAGNDADSAEIVSTYSGERYVNLMYTLGLESVPPAAHTHWGTAKTATTPAGKTVTYYGCDCGKIFEDEACTKEITDLNAWLAKGGSEDPASLSGNGNPATGITGNGTWGITLMMALLIGLILFGIKRGEKEY